MSQQTEKDGSYLPDNKKMEALGRLSCKVAHDLNNILGAIEGYATLAMGAVRADDPMREDLQEIRKAVAKAAAINKQLLVFSGRQMLHKKICSVNEVLGNVLKAEAGLSGGGLKIEPLLQSGLPDLSADPEQLAQVFLNLLANAREAMPEGGTITISSSLQKLEGAAVSSAKPEEAGTDFIKISVKDTGCGMNAEVLDHLFEPVASTREKNHGSRLGGLAIVYGVVRQHNGWVQAKSAQGAGSEFSVFLPAAKI